jgi:hypothetical protein
VSLLKSVVLFLFISAFQHSPPLHLFIRVHPCSSVVLFSPRPFPHQPREAKPFTRPNLFHFSLLTRHFSPPLSATSPPPRFASFDLRP